MKKTIKILSLVCSVYIFGGVCGSITYACVQSDTRLVASSNTLYIENPVTCTLSNLASFVNTDVLELVDAQQLIWLLKYNIRISGGGKLVLHGTDIGGDVNELRLLSANFPAQFIYINAYWGEIDIASTHIYSWDPVSMDVDNDTSNGRAFIHVVSGLDGDGAAIESTMNIVDSEIHHLGYYAAESYGLVWKVRGNQADIFDRADVYGSLVNSYVHHNYMGFYSYGAYEILISNNFIEQNESYGIDPHDDSDFLVIENNIVGDNGNHGIICSKRCNDLVINGNEVYNSFHGIMLHEEIVNTVVEDNYLHDNRGTGIALLESHNNTIRNNIVERNEHGVRLSLGSYQNTIDANTIRNNTGNGIFLYFGSDTPKTTNGRPKDNVFLNNMLSDNGRLIRVKDSDNILFTGNIFSGQLSDIDVTNSTAVNVIDNIDNTNLLEISSKGDELVNSELRLETDRNLTARINANGIVRLTNADGRILDPEERSGEFTITPEGFEFVAVPEIIQTKTEITALPLFATTTNGLFTVFKPEVSSLARSWYAKSDLYDQFAQFRLNDLLPSKSYSIFRNRALYMQLTSDTSGEIVFTDQLQPSVSKYHYVVNPSDAAALNARGDAYVRDGIYADQNFGKENELDVKQASANYARIGFLSFPISGITSVKSAVLKLTMATSSEDNITVILSDVADKWKETEITWNNQPAIAVEISRQNVNSINFMAYEFDVTASVLQAIGGGDSQVSFALTSAGSSYAVLRVGSREGKGSRIPQLILDLTE